MPSLAEMVQLLPRELMILSSDNSTRLRLWSTCLILCDIDIVMTAIVDASDADHRASFSDDASLHSDFEFDHNECHEPMSKSQAWNLYTSHLLSTWNMRTYEFAAVRSPKVNSCEARLR